MTEGAQQPLAGAIHGAEHVLPLRVYWEDTDAGGVVYHANYLRFMERARSDLMRLAGYGQRDLAEAEDRVAFVVRSCAIDYLRPARLDDALTVHSRFTAVGGATIEAQQCVRRAGQDLARATFRIGCIGSDGRARRLPATMRQRLVSFSTLDSSQPSSRQGDHAA
ncbi:tol-pal system-associated acyl-CoA thioesterase [Zavarzinia sp. CC-PAN008]|uniref:tol-pal system-associated acyl-CoA thioesterase n=1 Tax=Zavarzinia sp. CC-PAN008 TaxID=3243332 RepID=UPI003F74ACD6